MSQVNTERANALAQFLKMAPHEAARLSRRVEACETQTQRDLCNTRKRRIRIEGHESLPDAHAFVVALPFSRRSLLLIHGLCQQGRRVCVLRTPLAVRFLEEYSQANACLQFLSPIEMMRATAEANDTTAFVTFPDHTLGAANTNVAASMFGETFLFHALESLLLRKHGLPLFAFDGERITQYIDADDNGLDAMIAREIAWLAQSMEKAARQHPAELFSWEYLSRKSSRSVLGRCTLHLEVLKGFLRSWIACEPHRAATLAPLLAEIGVKGGKLVSDFSRPSATTLLGRAHAD